MAIKTDKAAPAAPETVEQPTDVETTPTEGTSEAPESTESVVPAESTGASGATTEAAAAVDEPTDVETVESTAASEETAGWSGEIGQLSKQSWYTSLPPAAQSALKVGLDTVRRNMDRAFHQKSAELAERRKALEERERLVIQLARGEADFDGTIDEFVQAQLADKTAELTRELQEARANRADPEEIRALKEQLAAVEQEKEAWKTDSEELHQWREAGKMAETRAVDSLVDRTERFLQENAPDVLDNPAALQRFFNSDDFDEDNSLALAYVRLKFPAPVKDEPVGKPAEDAPDAFDLMDDDRQKDQATATPRRGGGFAAHDEELRREMAQLKRQAGR